MAAHRQSAAVVGREGRGACGQRPRSTIRRATSAPATRRISGTANPALRRHVRLRQRSPVRRRRTPAALSRRRRGSTGMRPATGVARVVCYSPRARRHARPSSTSTASMRCSRRGRTRCASSARARRSRHVLIFENKGEVVGVSQPAPALPDLRDQLRLQDDRDRAARVGERHLAETGPRAVPGRHRAPSARTAAASLVRAAAAPSPSCPTSRAMPTRSTSRPRDARAASPTSPTPSGATWRRVLRDVRDPVRQPVADAVSLRDGAAPGADG